METNFEFGYQREKEFTKRINYREVAKDYSEESLKIEYTEFEGSKNIITVYIPKSIIDEEGNLPLWFAKKQKNFPYTSYFSQVEEDLYQAQKSLNNAVEGLPALIGTEKEAKRRKNIAKYEEKIANLEKEVIDYVENLKSRIAK